MNKQAGRLSRGVSGSITIVLFAVLTVPLFGGSKAPDAKASLEQQLHSLYPPVELAKDNLSVTRPGTILQASRPGIGMSSGLVAFWNTYKDGQITQNRVDKWATKGVDTDIRVGDKVYLTKIEVRPTGKEPSIAFTIQACGNCDFTLITTGRWRATVFFRFVSGALDNPDMTKVQQVIGEVFTIAQPPAPRAAGDPQPPVSAPAAPEQGPINIQQGQTPDQVISILGQPDRKATVGPKEIYFYKDMKITFQNGAVSDVQ